jgi:hypothetical protein
MTADDLKRILILVATNDPTAADEIDRLADKLHTLATQLRAAHATAGNDSGTRSTGGVGDRIRMQLIGPDGKLKHDTGFVN